MFTKIKLLFLKFPTLKKKERQIIKKEKTRKKEGVEERNRKERGKKRQKMVKNIKTENTFKIHNA